DVVSARRRRRDEAEPARVHLQHALAPLAVLLALPRALRVDLETLPAAHRQDAVEDEVVEHPEEAAVARLVDLEPLGDLARVHGSVFVAEEAEDLVARGELLSHRPLPTAVSRGWA